MKKRSFLLPLAAVILALALSNTAAAAPAEVLHQTFKGYSAWADFESVDFSGCISTSVWVSAIDGRIQQAGHPDAFSVGEVGVPQYDNCTFMALLSAFGAVDLPDSDCQIAKPLQSAALNSTIEVFDYISNTSLPVQVNLTWKRIGYRFTSNQHSLYRAPGLKYGLKYDFRDIGIFRSASVTGDVTVAGTWRPIHRPMPKWDRVIRAPWILSTDFIQVTRTRI